MVVATAQILALDSTHGADAARHATPPQHPFHNRPPFCLRWKHKRVRKLPRNNPPKSRVTSKGAPGPEMATRNRRAGARTHGLPPPCRRPGSAPSRCPPTTRWCPSPSKSPLSSTGKRWRYLVGPEEGGRTGRTTALWKEGRWGKTETAKTERRGCRQVPARGGGTRDPKAGDGGGGVGGLLGLWREGQLG